MYPMMRIHADLKDIGKMMYEINITNEQKYRHILWAKTCIMAADAKPHFLR